MLLIVSVFHSHFLGGGGLGLTLWCQLLLIQTVRALCETVIDLCKHNWAVLLTDVLRARQRGVSLSLNPQVHSGGHSETHTNVHRCQHSHPNTRNVMNRQRKGNLF